MPLAEEATGRTGTNFFARLLRGGVEPFVRSAGSQTRSQRVTFGLWALAVSYQAVHDAYRKRETMLATVMADRADWGQATRRQRQLAVASDAELDGIGPAYYADADQLDLINAATGGIRAWP